MTNQTILKSILDKAMMNGFDSEHGHDLRQNVDMLFDPTVEDYTRGICIRGTLFDPVFAKAFFGGEDIKSGVGIIEAEWKLALKAMIAMNTDEILKYMEQFL